MRIGIEAAEVSGLEGMWPQPAPIAECEARIAVLERRAAKLAAEPGRGRRGHPR